MLIRLLENCVSSVRRHGLAASAKLYWRRLHERLYERHLGIRSRDIINLRDLGLEHQDRREHYPTALDDFRRMEKFLWPRADDEVFLDYQSRFFKAEATIELGAERRCRVLSVAVPPVARP